MIKSAIKHLYAIFPFKHRLFKILRTFWVPPESIIQHLHFEGVLDLEIGRHEFKMRHYGFMIENEAFWLGLDNGWEKASMDLWRKLVGQSRVIFDIGSNTGIYALTGQAIQPSAQVYAFEPVTRVFNKLEQNIRLNEFPIEAFECALSISDGTATIYDLPTDHILSVAVNKDLTESPDAIPTQIDTLRLDTFIEREQLERIDLMKIDVETHEAEVLKGMGDYLGKFRPTLLIEVLNDEVGKNIETLIEGLGYLCFNIDEKNNKVRLVDRVRKSDSFNYLICREDIAHRLELL